MKIVDMGASTFLLFGRKKMLKGKWTFYTFFKRGNSMTCAVGPQYREESQSVVLLGCDSCTVSDGVLEERIHSKLCRVSNRTHEYLLVGSGPSRKNDLLQTMIPPIYIEDDGSVLKYMITLFVNELRKAFKAGGLLKTENGKETVDGHTLVGFQGRLFQISMDFHISEHSQEPRLENRGL